MNEWKKISDGLPPIGIPLIVTAKSVCGDCSDGLRFPVYYKKKHENSGYAFFWEYGDMNFEFLPHVTEIVAYMEFPEPYGEE